MSNIGSEYLLRRISELELVVDKLSLTEVDAPTSVLTKTGTYAILASDEIIRCDGTFTVTLPAATGSNIMYLVINVGTGTITIATTGGDTVNGAAPNTITTLKSAWYLDGAADNWDSNN
jgi:hypothetical protein